MDIAHVIFILMITLGGDFQNSFWGLDGGYAPTGYIESFNRMFPAFVGMLAGAHLTSNKPLRIALITLITLLTLITM